MMIIDHATADGDGDEFDDDGDLGMITVTPISNVVIMRIRDYDDDEGDGYDDDDGLDMVLLQAITSGSLEGLLHCRADVA